jgi:hypothetical protein
MIFSLPFIDFKNILHAHSHYAFSGWITLALLSMMVYQLLPAQYAGRKIYQWLLGGLLANAVGMLLSFSLQGYGFFSILFSTLFIFITYVYACFFFKDFIRVNKSKTVRILTVSALVCLVISSCGPFTLAYLVASKSNNLVLYKNAIYTYLHLQYSGFFTLTVFALFVHRLGTADKYTLWFSRLLVYSVVPSMFASYLWSYPGQIVRIIAVAGSLLSIATIVLFFVSRRVAWPKSHGVKPLAYHLGVIAAACFTLKMILQALTIIPTVGALVFANRPVIIGFLHLVLLGFISVALLSYFIQSGLLKDTKRTTIAVWVFICGVGFNELVLTTQGLGVMLMMSSSITLWLLFAAACCLLTGAALIVFSISKDYRRMDLKQFLSNNNRVQKFY